jgi:hypothetical protein
LRLGNDAGLQDRTGCREAPMTYALREERYIVFVGAEEHDLRVQELVSGATVWPESFRIQVPASSTGDGQTFYGATAREAVTRAMQYLSTPVRTYQSVLLLGSLSRN